jgi:hypothetical protein
MAGIVSVPLLAFSVACGQTPGNGNTVTPTGAPGSPSSASGAGPETIPAGDIPDSQAFVPYTAADGTFTVSVPEGWSRGADGPATVFTAKYNSVRVESAPAAAAPSVASAQATELPSIQQGAPGYQQGNVTAAMRKTGPVILITYRASSPNDTVTGKTVQQEVERYEFWRGGTEVVLTLASPVGSDNVDPWRTITDSFQWHK